MKLTKDKIKEIIMKEMKKFNRSNSGRNLSIKLTEKEAEYIFFEQEDTKRELVHENTLSILMGASDHSGVKCPNLDEFWRKVKRRNNV